VKNSADVMYDVCAELTINSLDAKKQNQETVKDYIFS
jgi:hypothetical protein